MHSTKKTVHTCEVQKSANVHLTHCIQVWSNFSCIEPNILSNFFIMWSLTFFRLSMNETEEENYHAVFTCFYIHHHSCTWLPGNSAGLCLDADRSNHDDANPMHQLAHMSLLQCASWMKTWVMTISYRPAKCQNYNYDYECAKAAVWKDYLCPYPLFDNKQFQQKFCVSKAIYETIRSAAWLHLFFRKCEIDCCGRRLMLQLLSDGWIDCKQVLPSIKQKFTGWKVAPLCWKVCPDWPNGL